MRGEVNSDFYRNLGIIGDTNWYNLEKQYVELKNVSDPSDVVLFPKELVLFKSNYDLHEKINYIGLVLKDTLMISIK